jgi:hypothetical protein
MTHTSLKNIKRKNNKNENRNTKGKYCLKLNVYKNYT